MKKGKHLVLIPLFLTIFFGFSNFPIVYANQAPSGWLDGADCEKISGWAYDPDTPSEGIAIHLYYTTGSDTSQKFLTDTYTNGNRPDVNSALGISGNHGYTISTPEILKDGQPHNIYAYGIDSDPSRSMNAYLAGSPKSITCSPSPTPTPTPIPTPTTTPTPTPIYENYAPIGNLDGADCKKINGWAYDPNTPDKEIAIHLYDGDKFITDTVTNWLRSDVNASVGISGNHGFSVSTPESLKDGKTHNIYTYGIDSDPSHSKNANLAFSPKTLTCGSAPVPGPAPTFFISNLTNPSRDSIFLAGDRIRFAASGSANRPLKSCYIFNGNKGCDTGDYALNSSGTWSLDSQVLGISVGKWLRWIEVNDEKSNVVNFSVIPLLPPPETISPSPTPTPTLTLTPTASFSPTVTPTPTPTFNIADINKDGQVNRTDFDFLVANFGKTGPNQADLNGDRVVNIFDYNEVVENYGQ